MKTILSSRRHHYVAIVSIFLIMLVMVALMAGMVGCGGGGPYNLTIASTAGGSVTTPGPGTFTYNAGTVVNLVATPSAGYVFVNWTGNVGTIANANAASTTITMNGNYFITANFAQYIQNNQIRLTLGPGTNAQGPWTIVNMAPVKALGRDVAWFGEYEYLSPVGPPNPAVGGPWPGALVPLWGPGVPRQYVGSGATWYTFAIGPVVVGGVPVTVVKTVSLLPVAAWGWAQISYQILPQAAIPSLWLYYSIDYCDGPVTGSVLDNMWSFNYPPTLPLIWFEVSSRQVTPLPLVTPPGGGLLVDTKGTGVGVLGSWQFPAGSTFPVTRYAGWWFNGLYDTWTNGNNLIERDDDGALAVNLGAVTTAGTVCDQLFIGELFGDPPDSPYQPPVPPAYLTAAFEIEGVQPQITEDEENRTVTKTLPVVGETLEFNALLSFDLNPSHTITQYAWDFGDGMSYNTTEAFTTHIYEHEQLNVTASLNISNNVGEMAHAEQTFDVTTPVGP